MLERSSRAVTTQLTRSVRLGLQPAADVSASITIAPVTMSASSSSPTTAITMGALEIPSRLRVSVGGRAHGRPTLGASSARVHHGPMTSRMRAFGTAGVVLAVLCTQLAASAQSEPPAPVVPPPAAIAQPPQGPAPPPRSPWRVGDPIPAGYHVEEKPRAGLVTAGFLVAGIPYGISAITAWAAYGKNESGWLLVPFAGPWVTLGRRAYTCNPDASNQTTSQSLGCVGDIFAVMGLVTDGMMQVAGGALLLAGYVATKPGLVPNDVTFRVLPMSIGTGAGAGAVGTF